eukprot:245615_1
MTQTHSTEEHGNFPMVSQKFVLIAGKLSVYTYLEHETRKADIYLPTCVIELCIKMIGLNSFVWNIDDLKLIRQMLFARWKHQISSDVFQIAKLNWKIELYPNGYNEKTKGFCGVLVKLLDAILLEIHFLSIAYSMSTNTE